MRLTRRAGRGGAWRVCGGWEGGGAAEERCIVRLVPAEGTRESAPLVARWRVPGRQMSGEGCAVESTVLQRGPRLRRRGLHGSGVVAVSPGHHPRRGLNTRTRYYDPAAARECRASHGDRTTWGGDVALVSQVHQSVCGDACLRRGEAAPS